CFDFITLEYKKTALNGFKEMVEKGIGPLIELQMIKNKNETFFGLCKGAKIGKENEESDIYLITIHDISLMHESLEKIKHTETELEKKYAELKKTYDTLMVLENKYKSLYDNSPDLLRTIDLNGIIVNCNESYKKNLGYTKDEIMGSSILSILLSEVTLICKKALRNGRYQELYPTLKSGSKEKMEVYFQRYSLGIACLMKKANS